MMKACSVADKPISPMFPARLRDDWAPGSADRNISGNGDRSEFKNQNCNRSYSHRKRF